MLKSLSVAAIFFILVSCVTTQADPQIPPVDQSLSNYVGIVTEQWLKPRLDTKELKAKFELREYQAVETIEALQTYFVKTLGDNDTELWNFQENVWDVIKRGPPYKNNPIGDKELLKLVIEKLNSFKTN